MQNERLARENARLKNHYSSRRYRAANVLANALLKVPGIKRLLGERETGDAIAQNGPDDRARAGWPVGGLLPSYKPSFKLCSKARSRVRRLSPASRT